MKINPDLAVFIAAPLLVLLSLLSAYSLHPYLAIGAMFASAIILFKLSNKADGKGTARIVGYSCAFACLLLIAGVPSGEIGAKPCPDYLANRGAPAKLSYFYSPFCPNCPAQEREIDELYASGANFTYAKYDMRYCRADAERFGFSATPCIAIEKEGKAQRACGFVAGSEIRQAMDG